MGKTLSQISGNLIFQVYIWVFLQKLSILLEYRRFMLLMFHLNEF